jgi:hypothetical protein
LFLDRNLDTSELSGSRPSPPLLRLAYPSHQKSSTLSHSQTVIPVCLTLCVGAFSASYFRLFKSVLPRATYSINFPSCLIYFLLYLLLHLLTRLLAHLLTHLTHSHTLTSLLTHSYPSSPILPPIRVSVKGHNTGNTREKGGLAERGRAQ